MRYDEAIKLLTKYKKIIVTGPQRSGTTITSRIIAHDLGLTCLDESSFNTLDIIRFHNRTVTNDNYVIQCPCFFHVLETLNCIAPDAALVVMIRDVDSIQASQNRIKWCDKNDKAMIGAAGDPRSISVIDYGNYARQKPVLSFKDIIELEYDSLVDHSMFVPKDLRVDFLPKQWSL